MDTFSVCKMQTSVLPDGTELIPIGSPEWLVDKIKNDDLGPALLVDVVLTIRESAQALSSMESASFQEVGAFIEVLKLETARLFSLCAMQIAADARSADAGPAGPCRSDIDAALRQRRRAVLAKAFPAGAFDPAGVFRSDDSTWIVAVYPNDHWRLENVDTAGNWHGHGLLGLVARRRGTEPHQLADSIAARLDLTGARDAA